MADHDIALITLIVSIVSVFVVILISFFQSKRRGLLYRILVKNKILTTEEIREGRVKIFYEEHEVSEVALTILYFMNYGNTPIAQNDFESSIDLNFSTGCKVLSAEVVKTIPSTIKPTISIGENMVSISPLLINPRDIILFKILTSKLDHNLKIESRIKGISVIDKRSGDGGARKIRKIAHIIMYVSGSVCFFHYILYFKQWKYFFHFELYSLFVLFFAIGICMATSIQSTPSQNLKAIINSREQ
jgi:hypothetical protein